MIKKHDLNRAVMILGRLESTLKMLSKTQLNFFLKWIICWVFLSLNMKFDSHWYLTVNFKSVLLLWYSLRDVVTFQFREIHSYRELDSQTYWQQDIRSKATKIFPPFYCQEQIDTQCITCALNAKNFDLWGFFFTPD